MENFDKCEKILRDSLSKIAPGSYLVTTSYDTYFTEAALVRTYAMQHGENSCATLTVKMYLNNEMHLSLDTLRFEEEEKNCELSGTLILKWLKPLYPDTFQKILLEDGSTMPVYGSNIVLTSYRKLTTGLGWYESHGFYANTKEKREVYQNCFLKFRSASIDSLTVFMWSLIAIRIDENTVRSSTYVTITNRNITKSKVSKDSQTIIQNSFKPLCHNSVIIERTKPEKITLSQNSIVALVYLIKYFGLPPNFGYTVPLNDQRHEYIFENSLTINSSENKTCIGKVFYKIGKKRNVADKVMKFTGDDNAVEQSNVELLFWSISVLLHILEDYNLLYRPYHLETDNSYTVSKEIIDFNLFCKQDEDLSRKRKRDIESPVYPEGVEIPLEALEESGYLEDLEGLEGLEDFDSDDLLEEFDMMMGK